uniref:Cytochrome P450 n=1 Tax=Ascaris lumbricoides TaxID=6252 RepID=A0A0M3HUZ2_ASCLU
MVILVQFFVRLYHERFEAFRDKPFFFDPHSRAPFQIMTEAYLGDIVFARVPVCVRVRVLGRVGASTRV